MDCDCSFSFEVTHPTLSKDILLATLCASFAFIALYYLIY